MNRDLYVLTQHVGLEPAREPFQPASSARTLKFHSVQNQIWPKRKPWNHTAALKGLFHAAFLARAISWFPFVVAKAVLCTIRPPPECYQKMGL